MIYKTLSTVVDDLFAYVQASPFGNQLRDSLQLLHQDAFPAPAGVLPRRRRVPGLPLPAVQLHFAN
jgi:hypothetical protein